MTFLLENETDTSNRAEGRTKRLRLPKRKLYESTTDSSLENNPTPVSSLK